MSQFKQRFTMVCSSWLSVCVTRATHLACIGAMVGVPMLLNAYAAETRTTAQVPSTVAKPDPILVLAWGLEEMGRDRPMMVSPHRNITMFYWLTQENMGDPALAKKWLDQQPEGRRTIFDWDVHRIMHVHPEDKLTTAEGEKFTAFWWTHGVAEVERAYDEFFGAYRAMGGRLDYYILDPEFTPGNLTTSEQWAAVEKDPRFASILSDLKAESSAELRTHQPCFFWSYQRYLMGVYYNRLFAVVQRHFPDVKTSDFWGHYNKKHNLVPWGFWQPMRDGVPGRYGFHVGTHQGLELYGVITYLMHLSVDGQEFGSGPFRSLMLASNNMRTAVLSSEIPVMAWIAWRGYVSDFLDMENSHPFSSFGRTDYYQESVFHAALCDPDVFLLWSAFRWGEDQDPKRWAQKEDLVLVDDLIDQINELVGYEDRTTLVTELSPWHAPFLLTGANSRGRSVWRLTPDPQKSAVELSKIKTSDNPLTFEIGNVRIVMPGARIHTPARSLSTVGHWIIGPRDLKPVITPSQ